MNAQALQPIVYPPNPMRITAEVVIFTIVNQLLKVLLVARPQVPANLIWTLPGGEVAVDEDLRHGANRTLLEETGVSGVFLEQLYTFGAVDRHPTERVISVSYYTLIPMEKLQQGRVKSGHQVDWFPLNGLPKLGFDHHKIIDKAHARLKAKLQYSTLAFQFMPPEFSLSELQAAYEAILNEKLDKRNFRKFILTLEQIEATGTARKQGAHRPAKLYRVKHPQRVDIIK